MTKVNVTVRDLVDLTVQVGASEEELEKRSTLFKALGYTFLGVGVAAAGTGAFMGFYYKKDYDDYRKNSLTDTETYTNTKVEERKKRNVTLMNTGLGLAIGGGVFVVTGIALIIVDAVKIQPQLEKVRELQNDGMSSFQISPVFSPEFNGLTLTGTF